MDFDENQAYDLSSAIYNLAINTGEAIGPTFGGLMTTTFDFNGSCIATSLICLFYTGLFGYISYSTICNDLKPKNEKELLINHYNIESSDNDLNNDNLNSKYISINKASEEHISTYKLLN